LNETSGKVEPAKVKALLDMGEKPIYELTTESGRAINTTGNHPYLTEEGWVKVSELEQGDEIAVQRFGNPQIYLTKNISTNSGVKYILISSCFAKPSSLVQIAEPSNKANAKYGASLLCGANFSALD